MNDFIKLSIDLTYNIYLENNIENFDNYNSSITCFIINLFSSIQNLGLKLDYLEIIFNDDNQCKKNLFDKIKLKKNIFIDGFKFNKLKISELLFDLDFLYFSINLINNLKSKFIGNSKITFFNRDLKLKIKSSINSILKSKS